ncbi:MAG: EAL domain-containing protein [Gammaproteobacteria bacterium]|nr:EAL domain-containing protein [Gammaproteobacteria bacterium]
MKLLLVEDNISDADYFAAALQQHQGTDVHITVKATIAEAMESLGKNKFDIIILALTLPDAPGMECIDAIQGLGTNTPIVVLSDEDNEKHAIKIMNKGVQDYLVKWEGDGRTIFRAIRYAIERKRSEVRLNYLAQYDALTGIPNRQFFHDQLERAAARARREGSKAALFFLDLDQFKIVNDTLGHEAGDQLLRKTATRLSKAIRAGDVLARLGGDEFAVLLEGIKGARDAEAVARSILNIIARPFQIEGRQIHVTTSIGITLYPNDNNDANSLLKNADIAMYQAKESGRNNFKFFTERMHDELQAYHQLEVDIKQALEQDHFQLAFQPKVNVRTRQLQGLEALLRWDCPTRGTMLPDQFIPVAEESGHIVPIGYWVLEEVCRNLDQWRDLEISRVPVSVNVSARQFQHPGFHKKVGQILRKHHVDPALIELELTERLLMEDIEATQKCLSHLKRIGVRISIDDFGTGHSCLNYLRKFPIDVLKIDKSFINDIGAEEDGSIIIEAIISLARSLKLDTVAEGVETHEQLEFLTQHGCHVAQGFLFGKPIRYEEVEPLLSELSSCLDDTQRFSVPLSGFE